ncbi:MAG: hypothetical protein R3F38_14240 [Gammaproteobacteria bacterium]
MALLTVKKGVDSFLYTLSCTVLAGHWAFAGAGAVRRHAGNEFWCRTCPPFKGASIGMITAGLMSLAFMGFSGLIKI